MQSYARLWTWDYAATPGVACKAEVQTLAQKQVLAVQVHEVELQEVKAADAAWVTGPVVQALPQSGQQ